jgi:hypothetical protein
MIRPSTSTTTDPDTPGLPSFGGGGGAAAFAGPSFATAQLQPPAALSTDVPALERHPWCLCTCLFFLLELFSDVG